MKFEDTFRHQGLRRKMVENLRKKGIANEEVLNAMMQLPRHWFVESTFELAAYEVERALPIGEGQTISQPFTVAYQTSLLLPLGGNQRILEIGTGSGYQASVLSTLGFRVFTIERHESLCLETRKKILDMNLVKLGIAKFGIQTFFGDGYLGLPSFAPYDAILVTCGAPSVPQALLNQLEINGKLIIPVGINTQRMRVITKTSEAGFEEVFYDDFRFVPFVQGKNNLLINNK